MSRTKVPTSPAARVWRAVRDAGAEGITLGDLRSLQALSGLSQSVIGLRVGNLKAQGHVVQPGGRFRPYLVNAECTVPSGYELPLDAAPAAETKSWAGARKVPTSEIAQIWRAIRNEGTTGITRNELGKLPGLSHIKPKNLHAHLYVLKSTNLVAQVGGKGSPYLVDSSCIAPKGYDDGSVPAPELDRDDGLVVPKFLEQPTRLPASIAVMTSPRSRIWRCVRDAGRKGASRAHVIERLPHLALVVLVSQLAALRREGFIIQPDGDKERYYVDADCRTPAGESPILGPGWGDQLAGDNAEESAPVDAAPSAVLTSAPPLPASWIPLQVDAASEGAFDQEPDEPAPKKPAADGWWADWPAPTALTVGAIGTDLGAEQQPAEAPAEPIADAPRVERAEPAPAPAPDVIKVSSLSWLSPTVGLNGPSIHPFAAALNSDWALSLQLKSGLQVALDADETRKLLAFVEHIRLPQQPSAQA